MDFVERHNSYLVETWYIWWHYGGLYYAIKYKQEAARINYFIALDLNKQVSILNEDASRSKLWQAEGIHIHSILSF